MFPARRFLSVKEIDDSLSLLIALEHLAQMGGCEGFFEEIGHVLHAGLRRLRL